MMTGFKRSSSFHLRLYCCFLLLCVSTKLHGSPHGTRRSSISSLFSLFNLKQRSRFWSESITRSDFDDLEHPTASVADIRNYTNSRNIANYLKLIEVDYVYIPVPINFIFIGFHGKGNHEFKLNPQEFERWFTKIDHIYEHAHVPHKDEAFTSFYKAARGKMQHQYLPVGSHINYNFSVHAIEMGEKVTSLVQHAINVLTRKDDVSRNSTDEDTIWQVDLDIMDIIISSLIEYLQLGDAYNIFILNPKHDAKIGKYGYRRGLSESEIEFLRQDTSLQTQILNSEGPLEDFFPLKNNRKPLYARHPMAKFSWTVTEDADTDEWFNMCLSGLSSIEKWYQGKNTSDIIGNKVIQLLKGKNGDMRLLVEKELKSGDFIGFRAECLTDLWIGKNRWAFIDLSAGPFSWGPAVGGEGVRTELSLPNVGKTVGRIAEASEEEAEDHLQEAIQERFSVFGDKDHQAIDILLAEIDVYELFAFKHCKGRRVKLALCEELDERMRDLKTELQSFDGEEFDMSKAADALKRMDNWNLFSDSAFKDSQNYTVARDSFLAHLGSTLWGSMRHIISPSIADGSFHYYEKISFQLFFVTQEKVGDIKKLPLDLKAVMEGLSSLLLSSQKVMFSPHMLSLSDDAALAMAFSVARRASSIPILLVNGTYRTTSRSYLDSSILQYQLKRLDSQRSSTRAHSSTLEVPIFWFILDESFLIDKHYQAKALSDIVIVVQSNTSYFESDLQCNGKSLLLDLRRPIKAALAAVSEHLSGLLPLHLVYSHAHETAIEEWVWSVGCNPFSITSYGWHISQFHSDSMARSYIITELQESIQVINSAISDLVSEHTTERSFKLFQTRERELISRYNYVIHLWRRVAMASGELRYLDALNLLHSIEDASKRFADYVNETVAHLHPIHCSRERQIHVEFDITTIPAFLFVGFILWMLLKPGRPKPKIN